MDEKAQQYAFKHIEKLSDLQEADYLTRAIWQSFPETLEQKFEEYCKNPSHQLYEDKATEYHGFISQVIQDCEQSTISFSDSIPMAENQNIEQATQKLFKEKVLQKFD